MLFLGINCLMQRKCLLLLKFKDGTKSLGNMERKDYFD